MFVGREQDLRALQNAYDAAGLQVVVVYGRRRVGKTSLLHEFVKDKPRVRYFTAQETSASENLRLLSDCLLGGEGLEESSREALSPFPGGGHRASSPTFSSFDDAFRSAFSAAKRERMVLVLDEYPYLAQSYPPISSLLQSLIDAEVQDARKNGSAGSQLFLVLCGSSLSFMEHQVLGEKSPLYGRRTAQIKVEPFDVFDAWKILGAPSPVKAIELYSLVGGVPLYLEKLQATKSVAANIASNILRPGAYLYVEPQNYLMQAVSSPAQYNAVMTAIVKGHVRPKEIADATGQSTPGVNKLLAPLIEMRIVERVTPSVKANRKQVRYRLVDQLFRFWYSFAPRYATAIEADMSEEVAERIADTQTLSTFVGPAFEEACRQWFVRMMKMGDIPLLPRTVGTWWGSDPMTKRAEEIDIVVEGADGELLVGECKWRNEKIDVDVLETLLRRALLLDRPIEGFYLFSKSGFTRACERRAAVSDDIRLITAAEMFAWLE